MLNPFKSKKTTSTILAQPETQDNSPFFTRLKLGLQKTRASFTSHFATLLAGKKALDIDLMEWLEAHLLSMDVGAAVTQDLIQTLTQKLSRAELKDATVVIACLQNELKQLLQSTDAIAATPQPAKPHMILVVGINGAGKTTTIGKLAKHFQSANQHVLLAAGDTFRAGAIEQLQIWGNRNQIPVIAQQPGADTSAVIYDAMQAAMARDIDIVIADTAGRLHTQNNLMAELKKIKRVVSKLDATAPHDVWLVLDAGTGQNALVQARQFHEAVGITGLIITKLDGTAKGGIVFAIAKQIGVPIRYIGLGEGIDDLRPFNPNEFVTALFDLTE